MNFNYLPKALVAVLSLTFMSHLPAQSPPENLTLDEENGMMVLQDINESDFYNEDALESVYLEFEQTDYWQQLHDCYDTENYVTGTLTYDGEVYDSIGAQFKGNTSYSKVTGNKYSFAIKLDYWDDGQDIEGYNTLNFNNAFEDPSMMREVTYSHLNRMNIPCAKANFIKLYINGEYWGVYSNVQQLNKDFTKEWFMTNNGSLWRADASSTTSTDGGTTTVPTGPPTGGRPGGDSQWGDGTTALNYLGEDTTLYQQYYTLKHSSQDDPWTLLLKVTDVLNNTSDALLLDSLSKHMDIDKILWFLAHETVFTDDDSYIMKGRQDFYVYYEPETGLMMPVEFDGNSVMDARNVDWDVFYNEDNENFPLMNRLYAIPELRQRYLAHVRTIIDELFDLDMANALIDKYDALISSAVETDPETPYSFTEYEAGVEELKTYFSDRKAVLLANTELQAEGVVIESVEHAIEGVEFASPAADEPVDVTTTISGEKGVSAVYLYYSSYYVGRFTKVSMYDDGQHNDDTANDGVYGATIPGYSSGEYVRYYVEAIADDAALTAVYSPVGAEHDVYYYRVAITEAATSEIVINEICASNTTVEADNAGEYDDWIELYNTTDETILLDGYSLTDNDAKLGKWEFENLSIEANSYLVIWADEDGSQGDDHANFKLSASGEEVYLFNANEEIVDQVIFDEQVTDITYGRIPNATGPFDFMLPTIGAFNNSTAHVVNFLTDNESSLTIYPNPADNIITIELGTDENTLLTLYDINGVQVLSTKLSGSSSIDVSQLLAGLYIARIENVSGIFSVPLSIK